MRRRSQSLDATTRALTGEPYLRGPPARIDTTPATSCAAWPSGWAWPAGRAATALAALRARATGPEPSPGPDPFLALVPARLPGGSQLRVGQAKFPG